MERSNSLRTSGKQETERANVEKSSLGHQKADNLNVVGLHFDSHAIPVFFEKERFHAAQGWGRELNYLYADSQIKNLLTIVGTLQK